MVTIQNTLGIHSTPIVQSVSQPFLSATLGTHAHRTEVGGDQKHVALFL